MRIIEKYKAEYEKAKAFEESFKTYDADNTLKIQNTLFCILLFIILMIHVSALIKGVEYRDYLFAMTSAIYIMVWHINKTLVRHVGALDNDFIVKIREKENLLKQGDYRNELARNGSAERKTYLETRRIYENKMRNQSTIEAANYAGWLLWTSLNLGYLLAELDYPELKLGMVIGVGLFSIVVLKIFYLQGLGAIKSKQKYVLSIL